MSRNLYTLNPAMLSQTLEFMDDCKIAGIDLLCTCALRTNEEQAALYAQGRTTPGRVVTNAKPGESAHQYGCAIDVVPLVNGKPVWEFDPKVDPWKTVGALGQARGLTWLGAPGSKFVEGCHFELPDWKSYRSIT